MIGRRLGVILFLALISSAAAAEEGSEFFVGEANLVFERKGADVEVEEYLKLMSAGPEKGKITIEPPRGATGPVLIGDDNPTAKVKGNAVVVKGPLGKEGTEVSIRYYLPIENERVSFDQDLGMKILSVQAISTWTIRGADIKGDRFSEARVVELASGVEALVSSRGEISNGRISVKLTGLGEGPEAMRRTVSLWLCAGLLGFGLIIQVRRRIIFSVKKAQSRETGTG